MNFIKIIALLILITPEFLLSQEDEAHYFPVRDAIVAQKLNHWQDARFGLLMHWGTYSQWGIVESWSLCSEDEGWTQRTMDNYEEYKQRYTALKKTFNPVKFDPERWAAAAQERRHEIRGVHDQAPRRLLHVRHAADRHTKSHRRNVRSIPIRKPTSPRAF